MAASIIELCRGVRDSLNSAGSGTFTEPFTAVFEYSPAYTIPETENMQVIVTDAGGLINLQARKLLAYTDSVRVVVLYRVNNSTTGIDESKMEASLLTLEEITEWLIKREIGDYKQTGVITRGDGGKGKQHYYPGNLDSGVIFASDLTIAYMKSVNL